MNSETPLTVEVFDEVLTIKIGIKTLAFAIEQRPTEAFMVTDCYGFAQDVCRELKREEEDGTTAVHLMLDKASNEAFEQGSENAQEVPASTRDSGGKM